jgi:hypothetical protein
MKNTIMVLTILLLSNRVVVQNDLSVVYPSLDILLRSEKNDDGLLSCISREQPNYRRFIELYNQKIVPVKDQPQVPVCFINAIRNPLNNLLLHYRFWD